MTNARDANASAIAINITEEYLEEVEWNRGIAPAGRYILLTVSDSGSGIELENHQKLFAVEYSTKENGIVNQHCESTRLRRTSSTIPLIFPTTSRRIRRSRRACNARFR